MAASLFSVIWNTMEWNWVGSRGRHECNDTIFIRLKLFPLYALSTAYKCISISVIVGYLRWYSVPLFGLIVLALIILDFFVRKNYRKSLQSSEVHSVKSHDMSESEKLVHKYQCKHPFKLDIYILLSNGSI